MFERDAWRGNELKFKYADRDRVGKGVKEEVHVPTAIEKGTMLIFKMEEDLE